MYNMMTSGWLNSFIMTFVPIFVVVDAVGNIPFVIGLSEGLNHQEKWRLINVATVTAAAVGLFFLFLGQFSTISMTASLVQ